MLMNNEGIIFIIVNENVTRDMLCYTLHAVLQVFNECYALHVTGVR